MERQNEIDAISEELHQLDLRADGLEGTDRRYVFYYDETNNIRRLRLTDRGFNIQDPECFALGGIVYPLASTPPNFAALRKRLLLDPGIHEFKLRHLGKGDFLSLLSFAKITTLLDWIEEEGIFIHYLAIDPLYWSIIDIIDTLADELPLDMEMLRAAKNSLYSLFRDDPMELADLMGRYDYPNVGAQGPIFYDELIEIVKARLDLVEEDDDPQSHFEFMMLKGIFQMGRRSESLPFLENEKARILIDQFGLFSANRITTFPKSCHIFDEEYTVREYLEGGALGSQMFDYRFVNSADEQSIQVSDTIIGLLGKGFSYCIRNSAEKISHDMSTLSIDQTRNLVTLSRLLDRAAKESNAFALRIFSNEDELRSAFVFDSERAILPVDS